MSSKEPYPEEENVYDEVTSVGFSNPTYINEGHGDYAKPPPGPYQNYPNRAPVVSPTDVVLLPSSAQHLEEERRKWKIRMIIVMFFAALIIVGLIAAIIYLVFIKEVECPNKDKDDGPIIIPERLFGKDGECKDQQLLVLNGRCVLRPKYTTSTTVSTSASSTTQSTSTTSTSSSTSTTRPSTSPSTTRTSTSTTQRVTPTTTRTTTSSSTQRVTPPALGNPPEKASLLMTCTPPRGQDDFGHINDLCWVNETTLVAVQVKGQQVIVLNIDTASTNCSTRVLDSGYAARRVSCSSTGNFYVSAPDNGFVKIFYANGNSYNWIIPNVPAPRNIAANGKFVVVDHNGTSPFAVYDMDRKYLRTVSIAGDRHEILYTYLSQDGLLVATGHYTHELYLFDMVSNSSHTTAGVGTEDGKFDSPGDVTDTESGAILVCDWLNDRVSVFNKAGDFLHHLTFSSGVHEQPNALSVISRGNGKPDLLALAPFPEVVIWIEELR